MISKTKIKSRSRKKTNPELVTTLSSSIKNPNWIKLAKVLSSSTKKYPSINLTQIDLKSKTGDTIIIPGKVLSSGSLSKKVKICALSISSSALEKLKESKSEFSTLSAEIKKNPKAEGLTLIK
jgi:large subunit ribosomal protein L18e